MHLDKKEYFIDTYKNVDVKKVVDRVDDNLSIENQIKEALKLLLK